MGVLLGSGGVSLAETWLLPPGSVTDFSGILEKSSLMPVPHDGNRGEDFSLAAFLAVFSLCISEIRLFPCFMSYTAHHKGIAGSAGASRCCNNCNKCEGYCTQSAA